VLQEVYMTVWRKAGTFDPALSSPMTRLIAIARNRAISLEPPGGSPTGQPTGPVIGSGKLTNL
jgi:anti-sigma-K factor RskA